MFLDRFLERRYTFKYPSDDFYDAWTGGERGTASGERVSPDKALGLCAYFAAARAISEDIGKLPRPLYKRLARGKKRIPEHPVYRLIDKAPNPECNAMSFWEAIVGHGLTRGNGIAEIQRSRGGTPEALWLLDPTAVRIYRGGDGLIRYEIRYPDRDSRTLLWEDVFHLHGVGFDGLTGYSIAHYGRETIGAAIGARRHAATLFGKGSQPGGVVSYPAGLADPKGWRKAWNEVFQGSDNAHQTAVLDRDAKYTPIGVPNKDAQWIEAQNFSIEEIARLFRMPPHKLQHLVYGTYANVDHLAMEYVGDTLTSWMRRIEQEIWRKLLSKYERATLFAEHIAEGLLRGDIATRYTAYKTAREWGWYSANDVLEKENENPLPGDQGDIYLVPLNMGDASKINEKQEPPPVPGPTPEEMEKKAADDAENKHMAEAIAGKADKTYVDANFAGLETKKADKTAVKAQIAAYVSQGAAADRENARASGRAMDTLREECKAGDAHEAELRKAGDAVVTAEYEKRIATAMLSVANITRHFASDASETGGERMPTSEEVIKRTVQACSPMLRDAYARALRIECDRIRGALKRPRFDKWIIEFREKHKPHVEDVLKVPVQGLCDVVWAVLCEGEPNGEVGEHIRGMADRYARRASNRLWRDKSDIDEYATTEVNEELPKLTEMLVALCVKE